MVRGVVAGGQQKQCERTENQERGPAHIAFQRLWTGSRYEGVFALDLRTDVCYHLCVKGSDDRPTRDGSSCRTAVEQLDSAVAAFDVESIDSLTDAALGTDLVRMRCAIDRLEAQFARRVARFDRLNGYAADGAGSMVSWLRQRCRLSASDAVQRLELGRRLPEIEGAEAAFRSGEVSFRNATILARAVEEMGAERVGVVADTLLEVARTQAPHRLRICTLHARHCIDPEGALADAERQHQNRWLNLSQTFDGIFALDGVLDAEAGTLLRTALDALSKPAANDDRTARQRRADALVELARRQLQAGDLPITAGQRPHLVVTTPAATLRAEHGAPGGQLDRGWPLPAETVRRIACDAAVTTITVDERTGEPLSVGRARRTIPPAMRRALVLRDQGCQFPGCDRPAEWTDAHHIRHWADDGATELGNLILLCRRCHRRVHEEGWRLERTEARQLVTAPP
jgi:Domain of unknown function (DUF222)/HNH endonuclease